MLFSEEIPDNWPEAVDINSYRALDRNFVFAGSCLTFYPLQHISSFLTYVQSVGFSFKHLLMSLQGEHVRLLVCFSANKRNSGTAITPSENVVAQRFASENQKAVGDTNSLSHAKYANTDEQKDQNGEARANIHSQTDASTGGSILGIDDQRRHTDQLLQGFEDSHFFARIAESNEPLWSERSAQEACFKLMETCKEKFTGDSSETAQILKNKDPTSVVIDRGELHSPSSGGVARGAAKCFSLANGDLVVCFPEHDKKFIVLSLQT